jgi:DNA-binding HxlR family transcriptional regulator
MVGPETAICGDTFREGPLRRSMPAPASTIDRAEPAVSHSPPNGDDGGVADHIESAAPPVASGVCPYYHAAVEMLGKRWTGAIVDSLLAGPLRFSQLSQGIPQISDRLLSMRLKELEAGGVVARRVCDGAPVRVDYELTPKGRALEPVVTSLRHWAREWLRD